MSPTGKSYSFSSGVRAKLRAPARRCSFRGWALKVVRMSRTNAMCGPLSALNPVFAMCGPLPALNPVHAMCGPLSALNPVRAVCGPLSALNSVG